MIPPDKQTLRGDRGKKKQLRKKLVIVEGKDNFPNSREPMGTCRGKGAQTFGSRRKYSGRRGKPGSTAKGVEKTVGRTPKAKGPFNKKEGS